MKSVLITCFKDETAVIQASHLANSIRKDQPHSEVFLVTYKDLAPAARATRFGANAFFIDRFKIEHLKSGVLYSDAFALNALTEDIAPLLAKEWTLAVNFSNDEVSSYLLPMLQTEKTSGAFVTPIGTAGTSDKWAAYRNFFITAQSKAPISPLQCAHHSVNVPYAKEGEKIAFKEDFTMVANQNFARIRSSKNNGEAKIIGINLGSDSFGKSFDMAFLSNIVETLEHSEEYKPVLLLNNDAQRKVSDELNALLDNQLISINMDITAAPSVLSNLDFLVTKPNSTAALADALDTRIIEVADKSEGFLACNEGNFFIREEDGPASEDVLFILNQEFQTVLPMAIRESQNRVYASVKDDLGVLKTLVRGRIEIREELDYHISRCYHHALLGYPMDLRLISNLKENVEKGELAQYCTQAKEELLNAVKTLLSCLRSLQGFKQSEKNGPKFIQYLDRLMDFSKTRNVAQAPTCLFEAAIENIQTGGKESLSLIEKSLYELKGDLQTLSKIYESLLTEKNPEVFFESQN